MTGRIPSRGSDQFNLRLPDGMRDRIAAEAAANGRSMNAEIVARLRDSMDRPHFPEIDSPEAQKNLKILAEMLIDVASQAGQTGKRLTIEVRADDEDPGQAK